MQSSTARAMRFWKQSCAGWHPPPRNTVVSPCHWQWHTRRSRLTAHSLCPARQRPAATHCAWVHNTQLCLLKYQATAVSWAGRRGGGGDGSPPALAAEVATAQVHGSQPPCESRRFACSIIHETDSRTWVCAASRDGSPARAKTGFERNDQLGGTKRQRRDMVSA